MTTLIIVDPYVFYWKYDQWWPVPNTFKCESSDLISKLFGTNSTLQRKKSETTCPILLSNGIGVNLIQCVFYILKMFMTFNVSHSV